MLRPISTSFPIRVQRAPHGRYAIDLVKSPSDWPGVISKRFGEQRAVEMPDHLFDQDGNLPEAPTLRFVRPQIFGGLSDAQLQAHLNANVAKLVK